MMRELLNYRVYPPRANWCVREEGPDLLLKRFVCILVSFLFLFGNRCRWICGTIGALWIGGRHAFEVGRYIM